MVAGGPFIVNTGKWSARAAADKYIVKEPENENRIWWGEYNRPASLGTFNSILVRLQAFLQGEELFVQDCFVGADPAYRMAIRVITEKAWHSHFARNMFITTDNRDELKRHVPEFTIIALPSFLVDPRIDGTRPETAIMRHFAEKLGIIANTGYGGEIKKGVFTIMNYLLPMQGVMAMHCSANVGDAGDVALFFACPARARPRSRPTPAAD